LLDEARREASEIECHFVMPQIMHLSAACELGLTASNASALARTFEAAFLEAVRIGAGQVAQSVLSDAVKAKLWSPQEIDALTARLHGPPFGRQPGGMFRRSQTA
jgi:hypothetical protein